MFQRNLNWFFQKYFLHISHGRDPGLAYFVDELLSGHGQRSFKSLLSLPASIKGILGSTPAGLTSFSRHGNEKKDDHSDDSVAVTTPNLRLVWLLQVGIEMGDAMAQIGDIREDGHDGLLH
jgi:hypothetical protein